MASKETLQLEMDADSSGLLREFKRVENQNKQMESSFSRTAKAATALGASFISLRAIKDVGVGVVSTSAKFETLNTSLTTVFKSQERAASKFKELTKFASETPFAIDELTQATIKMKSLGLDPSIESLKSMGNTSSAMGKSIMQFTEAIADAVVGEFERLKEFGIKSRSVGNDVEFTFQNVTTKVGKNAEEINEYLKSIGNNEFAGGMERQSNTLDGAFSRLRGSTELLAVKFSEESGLAGAVKDSTKAITEFINTTFLAEDTVESLDTEIDRKLKELNRVAQSSESGILAGGVAPGAKEQVEKELQELFQRKHEMIVDGKAKEAELEIALEKEKNDKLNAIREDKLAKQREIEDEIAKKASEKLETDFEALDNRYKTEREMLDNKLNEELALIESAQAKGLVAEERGHKLKSKIRMEWAKKLILEDMKLDKMQEDLKRKKLLKTASFFGAMAEQSKGFAIAEAITNTWLGVSQTLAAYPMPIAAVFAAGHLIQGFKAVNNIRSGSSSGSIDSGPSAAPEIPDIAGPEGLGAANDSGAIKTIRLDIEGLGDDAVFNKAFLRNLTDQINEESESNVLIKVG